jgi:AcrR family transcriptional regulator
MDRKNRHRPRAPHQLPPGRHKLGRNYVETNQRDRILQAVADVSTLAGYTAMSVEDIISVAGVSRRTFYDAFSSKEDAFLQALDGVVEDLEGRVKAAYEASHTFPGGVRDCLAAFLDFVTERPHQAEMLLIEALAAGPAAIERRRGTLKTFANLLGDAADRLSNGRRPPGLIAETVVGGIYEVVYSRLIAGEAERLGILLPDLAYSLMQPFIGDAAAKRESSKAPSARLTPGTAAARA